MSLFYINIFSHVCRRDVQGRLIPSPESISIQSWQEVLKQFNTIKTNIKKACVNCVEEFPCLRYFISQRMQVLHVAFRPT